MQTNNTSFTCYKDFSSLVDKLYHMKNLYNFNPSQRARKKSTKNISNHFALLFLVYISILVFYTNLTI